MNPNDEEVETKEFQPMDFTEETRDISRRLHEWLSTDDSERLRNHGRLVARNAGAWNSRRIGGFTFCPFPHGEESSLAPTAVAHKGGNAQRTDANAAMAKRTKEAVQKASKTQLLGLDDEPVLVLQRDQFRKPTKEQQPSKPVARCASKDGSVVYKHGASVEQVLKEYREANMYSRVRLTKVDKRELASAIVSVRSQNHETSPAEPAGERGGEDIFTRLSQKPERKQAPVLEERSPQQVAPRSSPLLQVCSLSFGQTALPFPRSKPTAPKDGPLTVHAARSLDAGGPGDGRDVGARGSTYSLLLAEQGRVLDARSKCLSRRQDAVKTCKTRTDPDARGKPVGTPQKTEPKYRVTVDFDGPARRAGGGGRGRRPPEPKPKGVPKRGSGPKTGDQLFVTVIPIEPPPVAKTFGQDRSKVTARRAKGEGEGAKETSPNALGYKITVESLRGDGGGRGEDEKGASALPTQDDITEILPPQFGPDDRPQSDNEVIIRGYLGLRDDPRDDFDIVLDSETLEGLNGHTRNEIARMSEGGRGGKEEGSQHDGPNASRSDCLFARGRELRSRLRSDPLLSLVGDRMDEVGSVRRRGDPCPDPGEVASLLHRLDIDSGDRQRRPAPTVPNGGELYGRTLRSSFLHKYEGASMDRLLVGEGVGAGDRGEAEKHPNTPVGSHSIACGSDEAFAETYPRFGDIGGDIGGNIGEDVGESVLDKTLPKTTSDVSARDSTVEVATASNVSTSNKTVRFSDERVCEVKNSAATTDLSDRGGLNDPTELARLDACASTSRRYLEYLRAAASVDVGLPPRPGPSDRGLDVTPNREMALAAKPSPLPSPSPLQGHAPETPEPPSNSAKYTELTRSYTELLSKLKNVNNGNDRYKTKKRR